MILSLIGRGEADILLTLVIQITLVAAVPLLFSFLIRSAAWRHNILWAGLIGVVTAPMLLAASRGAGVAVDIPILRDSGAPPRDPPALSEVVATATASDAASQRKPDLGIQVIGVGNATSPTNSTDRSTSPKPTVGSRSAVLPWKRTIELLWLSIAALLLVGIARAARRARRIRLASQPIDSHASPALTVAAQRLGITRFPEVRLSPTLAMPAAAGFLHPLILIPNRDWEVLSQEQLTQVLVHEGAHAVRRDPFWILLQRITGALFWWHPLIHAVNSRLNQAREEICDNFVLRNTPCEEYGGTLLLMAVHPRPAAAGLLGLFSGGCALERRIAGILDIKRSLSVGVRRPLAPTSILCVALLSLVVATARAVALPDNANQNAAPIPDQTETPAPIGQQQVRMPEFEVEQIHPSMQGSELWLDLRNRLKRSAVQFRVVEIDENGHVRLSLAATPATDLSHLQGAPLTSLDLSNTGVRDLTPLQGMPLEVLDLSGTQVVDLTPLSGLRIRQLNLMGLAVRDLSPLRDARLVQLVAIGVPIEDLSVLSGMPLEYLDLRRTNVRDLTPLASLPMETVQIEDSPISDLTPLRETRVKTLWLKGLKRIDLTQLSGMQLERLVLQGADIADITPLRGMSLESLSLENTSVVELGPIVDLPLNTLSLMGTHIADLTPLAGMSLKDVYLSEPGTDLAPLKDMPLETIALPPLDTVKNIELLRNMPNLKWIRPPECKPLTAEEFWKAYDSGRAAGPPGR